jgi:uncharacterized membrane protein HdeD (DUF308 family)
MTVAQQSDAEGVASGRRWRSAARWLLMLLGVVATALGVYLLFRPFTSLATLVWLVAAAMVVNGLADLLGVREEEQSWVVRAVGVVWLVASLLVLTWAALTLRALAVVVGVLLVLTGIERVVSGVRGTTDQRWAAALLGVAEVFFGVLALSWPDLTLLVVAVVFGARMVMFGLSVIGRAWRTRRPDAGDHAVRSAEHPAVEVGRPRPWWRRLIRLTTSAGALFVALALLGVSAIVHAGAPVLDEFYTAPRSVPDQPGQLIRSESYSTALPAGAAAWRILYTTTRPTGDPAVASAIVMRPVSVPPGPRPVIAWAHGTTGFAENCAPSVLKDGLRAGALPAADQILTHGWVLVATDYVGLGTEGPQPYLIGPGEARSVLDAVRAARQLKNVSLSGTTVVWGHSQGGGAALWTGGLAPSYAPDVPLAGVAALAPASDLVGLADNLDALRIGSIFASYIVAAYTDTYPDVRMNDYIRPTARTFVDRMSARCLSEPAALISVGSSLAFNGPIFSRDPARGPFGRRLTENTPTLPIPAPLLIAQGSGDPLILPALQSAYAKRLCDAGQALEYRPYPGRDHLGVVAPDSPLIPYLVSWTEDRIAGRPAPTTC